MAKSAREWFEEAMKLDPEERATLLRLLIESVDVESEEGVDPPRALDAEWLELPPGFILPPGRRLKRHTTATQSATNP